MAELTAERAARRAGLRRVLRLGAWIERLLCTTALISGVVPIPGPGVRPELVLEPSDDQPEA
jgi:hypothetical protein